MKKRKIWWLILGLVVVVILLVALKSKGVIGKEEGLKVSTEKVTKRTIIETVNASGKVYPEIEVKISPDISGEIVELKYDEGDSVKKGAVLARIYADIYSTQRNQAAAVVDQQQATVENSKAQLESLLSAQELAQRTYDRQKQLLAEKVISDAEFEQAQNNLRTAKANYNAALQNIRSGQASIASAQASLERADKDLGRTAVVATMDGVVSLMNVKKGERVVGNSMMAGTEMMRIADMSVMEVQVDVGENDIPKVSLGDSALIEIDAYNNRKFKGLVTKIAASNTTAGSAAATSSSNDVTNYKVHIRILPESYKDLIDPSKPRKFIFRPGMNASADIQTTTRPNVIAAAMNAVTTREKGTDKVANSQKDKKEPEEGMQEQAKAGLSSDLDEVVFVLQANGTVKRVKVRTGIQDIGYIEVLGGLKEGDEIVTAPYNVISKTLKDGMKVKVVPADKLFEEKK
ncbi:HlyD family efflux transporter periplasmic adaptor subunit [Pseudoflavitalea sp. X16]|uniref:efflux RND transporter periplasmic adaptor subunit n=1 Tax=Paraflavitalea devenefica TaxID=2716334 RepID=UPI00141DEBDF|nr:efflux RND transporter periplasmic adaptor subunit [Paraflavitalea devenefica]NII23953.1 HlyD family efflux transporter periplasmic adaptor subunit [Paraflavitalea devenefica]